jgi:hypothetical protein
LPLNKENSGDVRMDDGRPTAVSVSQRDGKIHAVWTEDSVCSDRFSVERVVLENGLVWEALAATSTAPFEYSNDIEEGVRSKEYVAKAVVTDHFSTASICGEVSFFAEHSVSNSHPKRLSTDLQPHCRRHSEFARGTQTRLRGGR